MRSLSRRPALAAAGAVIALTAAACGHPAKASAPASTATGAAGQSSAAPAPASTAAPSSPVALTETGSTLLYPLFNLWAPAYHSAVSTVSVTTAGTGSGTGISQASAGAVNIGASDAYLSSAQIAKYPGLENIPLAISAQQINYNLPGLAGAHLKLNGKLLSAIYQGKLTKWNAPQIASLNPGVALPNMTIVPLHRSDGSGDTFIFTTYLSKQDPNGWGTKIGFNTTVAFPAVPGALGENGNGGMVSGCQATPGCIAYIGISFLAKTQHAGLGEAMLGNGSGNYLLPTATSIQAEERAFSGQEPATGTLSLVDSTSAPHGYPIINFEYAIVNKHQPSATTAQAIRSLLSWAINPSNGSAASFLSQVQFQPLSGAARQISQQLINGIGS